MSLSNTTFIDETNIAYLNAGTNVTYLAGTTAYVGPNSKNGSFIHFNKTSTVSFTQNANFTLLTPMTVNFAAQSSQKLTAMNSVTATFSKTSQVAYKAGTDLTFMS